MPRYYATAFALPLLPYCWSGTPTTLRFHRGGLYALLVALPLN